MWPRLLQWLNSYDVLHWLRTNGARIVAILILAAIIRWFIRGALNRLESRTTNGTSAANPRQVEHLRRKKTILQLVRTMSTVFILAIVLVMILRELGYDITAIVTGASIAGLVLALGAQQVVKDVASGFFMILEDQVRVGDVVEVNGTSGLVEAVNLRTIILRDVRGAVHVFPCGSINSLANLTKDYSYAVLDVRVDYKHDTDEVIDVMRDAANAIQADPEFKNFVLEPLEVLGVEHLGDSGVTIRIRMKTVPLKQWDVVREMRRRIKKAFETRGIEIPVIQPAAARVKSAEV